MRKRLLSSQIAFTKFFFRARGEVFIPGDHHPQIEEALLKVEQGIIKNLLITIAPRFGKTQIATIDWPARCIAKNPRAKFIHLSYSDDLALDNSGKCRETIGSKEYQELWPVKIKPDSDSKKKWYTEQGGGMYATAAGGPVTGFGAGSLADVVDGTEEDEFEDFFAGRQEEDIDPNLFYGAIIIDDPIKVDDAYNERAREIVNKRLNSTIKNRRNSRNTPIIVIMQRLHPDDLSGFILNGGMGEEFHHLNLTAIVDFKQPTERSLWPAKHTLEELKQMLEADHDVFMAQYMQDPSPEEGVFFKREWFRRFRLGEEPTRLIKYGAGDYAVTEDAGDWTRQAVAGFDVEDDLWFLKFWSGRVTLDKSIDGMMQLALDYDPVLWAAEAGVIRRAMEPFVLKEQKRRRCFFKLEWLPANASKAVNAKSFQALCSQGKVHVPYGPDGDAFIAECLKFTGKDDKTDDFVDLGGLFGRLLSLAFGPEQYHEQLTPKSSEDDYQYSDDDGDDNDWRTS